MNLTIREVLDRYGPALAVLAALVLLVALVPGRDDGSNPSSVDAAGAPVPAPGATIATPAGGAGSPGSATPGAGASAAPSITAVPGAPSAASPVVPGGQGQPPSGVSGAGSPTTGGAEPVLVPGAASGWGPEHGPGNQPPPGPNKPCRADGREPSVFLFSSPCFARWEGDNGGATAQGVTADSVKVVWYNDRANPAQEAALTGAGAGDNDAQRRNQLNAFFRYFNLHGETYGREVQLVEFEGTGDPSDDQILRSDAVSIAENEKPFAVFHHSGAIGTAFSEELAARGVICVCSTGQARSFHADTSPYTYTRLPVLDQHYEHVAEYIGQRLAGKPATYAGLEPAGRIGFNDVRTFGLVFLDGSGDDVNPRAQPVVDAFKAALRARGVELAIDIGYQYNLPRAQQTATNIISQLINAGVNNVIFIGEPLTPVFLTNAATQQNYNPEWFVTGTLLLDSSFFGRTYDKNQWQRAFGVSPLAVNTGDQPQTPGWRAMHHIDPVGDKGVSYVVTVRWVEVVFQGIHLAGPDLNPTTFHQGLVLAPPHGGTVTEPLIKYTTADPSGVKDFVEVWWDVDRPGTDEVGNDGVGMMVKANGATRYQLTQWPAGDPLVFDADPNPVVETDEPSAFDHATDGHTHDDDLACQSCDFPSSYPYIGG